MATQLESYQDAARLAGWTAAWQEMLRFVLPIIKNAGRYEDTRNAVLMRDLCTSQLFMSGAPGGVEPGKLSPEIATLPRGDDMTLQVNISAHAADKERESQMIDAARSAAAAMAGLGEVYLASASTSYHGPVDLKADAEAEPAPE